MIFATAMNTLSLSSASLQLQTSSLKLVNCILVYCSQWKLSYSENKTNTRCQVYTGIGAFIEVLSSIGSSSQVGGGQETWNLGGRLWRPSFLWLICTGLGGDGPLGTPPGSATAQHALLPGACLWSGRCIPACTGAEPPPCEQNDWQTGVKT